MSRWWRFSNSSSSTLASSWLLCRLRVLWHSIRLRITRSFRLSSSSREPRPSTMDNGRCHDASGWWVYWSLLPPETTLAWLQADASEPCLSPGCLLRRDADDGLACPCSEGSVRSTIVDVVEDELTEGAQGDSVLGCRRWPWWEVVELPAELEDRL